MTHQGPSTYAELFSDPDCNPITDDQEECYARIAARWRTQDGSPTKEQVLADAVRDLHEPTGVMIGYLEDADSPTGILHCLISPREYQGRPGQAIDVILLTCWNN